ncbi:MAG: hypothetical protein AAFV53_05030 [Myxococcota bacterium]
MNYRSILLASVLFALPVSPAYAVVHAGNPHLEFWVDPPEGSLTTGDVTLDRVRVHLCGGGYTDYPVGAAIDPVAGYGLTIQGGDLCKVTFFWDSDMTLEGSNAIGAYSLRYTEAFTEVVLSGPDYGADLDPFIVENGVVHAGNPHLPVEVD